MTLFLGFDLNGIWDFVAEGDDASAEGDDASDVLLKDLGIHGSLVRLAMSDRESWVGGIQAALAPHGKGPGWGQIGESANRVFLQDVLDSLAQGNLKDEHAAAFQCVLETLSVDARGAVFAVPDIPEFDEAARDRLLRLLARSSRLRSTLLWRPMAAVLGWIEETPENQGFPPTEGLRIAVLSLMDSGIQLADAKLVRVPHNGAEFWVPERDKAGVVAGGACAGETLVRQTAQDLAGRLDLDVEVALLSVNAPWRRCVGEEPKFELLRMPNRSWRKLPESPAPDIAITPADLPQTVRDRLESVEALVIEGPMTGNADWVDAILRAAGWPADRPVHRANRGLVAKGCLAAALRSQEGAPVYFDFLPQLEINALVVGEPDLSS